MGLGILTYNVKHRKTYDTLCLLKSKGYCDITVYAFPLHYTKKVFPLIEHRPGLNMDIPYPKELCMNFAYKYVEVSENEWDKLIEDMFLVCGAGILPMEFVQTHCIINAHPGYIPESRGLDAFKWAIYEGKRIGVTTHILGEWVDAGEIIERKEIPVYSCDTFHAVSQRLYEYEIDMLVGAVKKINEKHILIDPGDTVVHRRMPHELEKGLLEKFELYKKNKAIGDK